MNALINETSPYLLQHAHNPVNWYPWGEEALRKAKEEDKPILVSIGYAACHWCHVMERESFEDEATAAIMNEHFINIKIDREERPDLDHIYMDAVQAMTGSGGWPLNVFLTPDTKPFYGGTYFPPERAYNRASWKEILEGIRKTYAEKRHEITAQAENLTAHLVSSNAFGIQPSTGDDGFSAEQLQGIAEGILLNADRDWGGFGRAPKFPQTFSIQYLLRHYHFTKYEPALQQALLSLDKMIDGGIYDQLGGGFARYSTDNEWLAPHFEKMLYDNALLVGIMAEAFQLTHNQKYADCIRHTLAFVERELLSADGGFYSALDADSEGVEGKFYVWNKAEIDALLGEADSNLFCAYYDVTDNGNWEHTNILRVNQPLQAFAITQNLDEQYVTGRLAVCREVLLNERSKRIRPALDDKILLGWNALMNTAYSKAFAALGDETYRQAAIRNMHFLESRLPAGDGSWRHTFKGEARIPAFLDDYAYLIQAYIHLQEITANGEYLLRAKQLTEWVIENFEEEETGFFFYTHRHQSDVILRKKEVYDGAVPSGNAVMAHNLLYLSLVFDQRDWERHARQLLQSLYKAVAKHPGSFGVWALAMQLVSKELLEIAITGPGAQSQLPSVLQAYIPNKIIQAEETNSTVFPLLAGKIGGDGERTTFYICKNHACKAPFFTVADLLANV